MNGNKYMILILFIGTNVEKANKILDDSALKVIPATDLADAAEKVVKIANIMEMAQKAELHVNFELPL